MAKIVETHHTDDCSNWNLNLWTSGDSTSMISLKQTLLSSSSFACHLNIRHRIDERIVFHISSLVKLLQVPIFKRLKTQLPKNLVFKIIFPPF